MNRIAVCPGSYDPVTVGHLDIIKRALIIFGKVEVVAMYNSEKNYMFPIEKRLEMLQATFEGIPGVECRMYPGMLYDYLAGREECVIVKGIRNTTDFEYENRMAEFNLAKSGVETLFLPANEKYSQVSSTLVKKRMKQKVDYFDLLPNNIIKLLDNKL